MTLDIYVKPGNITVEDRYKLLKKLRKLAKEVSIQFALYYYIYARRGVTLHQLYRVYCELAGRAVRLSTVRKQLAMLERKGLARRSGDKYIALIEPEEAITVFDTKRSRTGKKRALKRVLNLHRKSVELEIPQNLTYYVSKVYKEVQKLLRKGDSTAALDLLVHTYLPLRKTDVLWLWRGNKNTLA